MGEVFKLVKYDNQKIIEPTVFELKNNGEDTRYLSVNKDIVREISKILKISGQVSKNLYSISPQLWRDVVKFRSKSDSQDIPDFDLNDYYIVMYNDFAICIVRDEELLNKEIDLFEALINSLESEMFMNDKGVLQILLRDEDSNAIVMIDLDIVNGIYRLFNGVMVNDLPIISSKPVISEANFGKFLCSGIEYEIKMAIKTSSSMKEDYSEDIAKKIHLSCREVMNILSLAKSKVVTSDTDGNVIGVSGFEDPTIIIEFLNSFGMAFKSLKKLSSLRKSIRSNSITLDDMFKFLANEYYNIDNNVNASVISQLLDIYYTRESDTNVISEELKLSK